MDFDFSERQGKIRDEVRRLFTPDSRPSLEELENGNDVLIRSSALHWLKILGRAGYLVLGLGDGRNTVELVAAQESLATVCPSLFLSVEVSTRIFGRLIAIYGTPDQRAQPLPALGEGELIGTVAISEGCMSLENNPLSTTGVSFGQGLMLNGSKSHVVNAAIADWIAVAGKAEENAAFFLINKGTEGLSIGQRLPTLGYNGTATSTITLENCPISSKYVIGPFEEGQPLAALRTWEDQILTAASLGLMQRSYDSALRYAKSHKSGGKPIIAYQEVGFKLAEMLTLVQTAQLLAYRAAWMAETQNREETALAHCAKIFCTESAETVASNALQILGGQGYISGNPAEAGYRDAKYLQIAGTSSEISRIKLGDRILEGE
jgi:alkylation response protein AidB-like acyl-CoA dehydrogenase